MVQFERPKFGLIERLKEARRHIPTLDEVMKVRLGSLVKKCRDRVHESLLRKRIPYRNPNGSIRWDDFFAIEARTAQPIRRLDVFPNGTQGMREDEIIHQAKEFIVPLSVSRGTPVLDPNEFPEIIDEESRVVAGKINQLPFARTVGGCSGHKNDIDGDGYGNSYMVLTMDRLDPRTALIEGQLLSLAERHTGQGEKVAILRERRGDVDRWNINVQIQAPIGWKETELPDQRISPRQYLDNLESKLDFTPEVLEEGKRYALDYFTQKNTFGCSEQCRGIRNRFWNEVGEIADGILIPKEENPK